jgi:replication factor C subunit 1
MPSDIRSFFGGKPAAKPAETAKPKETTEPRKRGRARKVVEDDEDDEEPTPKKTPAKRAAAKKQPSPEPVLEETTADDFFGKGTKPKRSEPVRPKTRGKPAVEEEESKPAKPAAKKAASNGRASTRNKTTTSYVDLDADDFPDDDLEEDADDVFKAGAKRGRKMEDKYEEGTDDDDEPVQPKRTGKASKQMPLRGQDPVDGDEDVDMKDTNPDDDFVVPDDDEEVEEVKPAKKTTSAAAKKRKAPILDDEDDEDDFEIEEPKPAAKRAAPAKKAAPKATPAKKQKMEEPKGNSSTMQAIFDSIPTIEAPPPPDKDEDGKSKFKFGQHKNSEAPAGAIDPSDFPSGEDNCLAGLSFVFTGQLSTLGRESGSALIKQYGGKVVTAPSKKTSYVILGEDAGPKKLETIKAHNLEVINEQGLFELIRRLPANGGDSTAAEDQAKKRKKEEDNIRKAAEEMEQQERERLAAAQSKAKANEKASQPTNKATTAAADPSSQLWTVRHAPQSLSQICGNKAQVEKLGRWLRNFPKNQRTKFKMAGQDGSGTFRAVMIHGPPGIGKTTAAHLVAKLEGYDIVESNASDTRSKKLIENSLKGVLSTTSLMGYFSSGAEAVEEGKKKLVLIMDEVDGLSAGDRGGVGAIAAVAKKSQIPMILICNERKQPKMKPFDFITYDLGFRRPTTDMIRGRIATIAYREGLKMPAPVLNALIEGTGADIRQVINMISTSKLDDATMSFEDSKDMSKAWEKHIILKPWDMVGKILNGAMFNAANKSTLNDKQELYFNDHDFAPLMLQENYLGTQPTRSNKYNGNDKKKRLANLDLISKAADSISDGDLVDRMIHGSQQQWSLMPVHAMFSFVRPASFVYGTMAGNQTRFTAWMGKNSTQGKLMRMIKEIQGHMRLRTSGDRFEIRQTYLPLLFDRLIKRLEVEGKDAVPEIIELMDEYFLTKDDWDAILELGVGEADQDKVKIDSQAKSTFTRL